MVFRCLTITATVNKERSRGTIISDEGNSGTATVAVGDVFGDVVGTDVRIGELELAGIVMVCVVLQPLMFTIITGVLLGSYPNGEDIVMFRYPLIAST